MARDAAQEILAADPQLTTDEGRRLDAHLHRLFDKNVDWSQIS
jgi:hypothetical protein